MKELNTYHGATFFLILPKIFDKINYKKQQKHKHPLPDRVESFDKKISETAESMKEKLGAAKRYGY